MKGMREEREKERNSRRVVNLEINKNKKLTRYRNEEK
jgi:hypothetical protein